MIQITIDNGLLSSSDHAWLNKVQSIIDGLPSYDEKKKAVNQFWKSKNVAVFARIRSILEKANIGNGYCNYCEYNEPGDIEHFYPKKLFPEKTFKLENYLFACPQCNQRAKGDQFAIFDSLQPLVNRRFEKKYKGPQPVTHYAALINPLVENPLDYLFLSLRTGKIIEHPTNLDEMGRIKFENTEWMFNLNARKILVEGRSESLGIFAGYLREYVDSKACQNFDALCDFVKYPNEVDRNQNFDIAKQKFLNSRIEKIQKRHHRTVWEEMKRQRDFHPELKALFDAAPEALSW